MVVSRLYDSQWRCLLDLNFKQKLILEIVIGVQNLKEGLIYLDLGYQPWFSDLIWFKGTNDSLLVEKGMLLFHSMDQQQCSLSHIL